MRKFFRWLIDVTLSTALLLMIWAFLTCMLPFFIAFLIVDRDSVAEVAELLSNWGK